MKKIILALSILSIISCRDNDNDDTSVSIIGKWSFQKVDVVTTSDNQTNTTELDECSQKTIHEFQQTVAVSTFYGIIDNTCQLTGEVNTRKYTFDPENMTYWYEGEEDYPYYIITLNDTQLVFEDRSQDIDNDGKTDIVRRYFVKM